jgi:tetrahydromethanopterin S-methyltransferase subunit E
MGVETPPKYVKCKLNFQIGIRGQNSHFSQSDGAPPTSMLLCGAAHSVKYIVIMQMIVHALKGLLVQQGVALPLLYRSTATEWHC